MITYQWGVNIGMLLDSTGFLWLGISSVSGSCIGVLIGIGLPNRHHDFRSTAWLPDEILLISIFRNHYAMSKTDDWCSEVFGPNTLFKVLGLGSITQGQSRNRSRKNLKGELLREPVAGTSHRDHRYHGVHTFSVGTSPSIWWGAKEYLQWSTM
jgi:hypothetical protein